MGKPDLHELLRTLGPGAFESQEAYQAFQDALEPQEETKEDHPSQEETSYPAPGSATATTGPPQGQNYPGYPDQGTPSPPGGSIDPPPRPDEGTPGTGSSTG